MTYPNGFVLQVESKTIILLCKYGRGIDHVIKYPIFLLYLVCYLVCLLLNSHYNSHRHGILRTFLLHFLPNQKVISGRGHIRKPYHWAILQSMWQLPSLLISLSVLPNYFLSAELRHQSWIINTLYIQDVWDMTKTLKSDRSEFKSYITTVYCVNLGKCKCLPKWGTSSSSKPMISNPTGKF